MVLGQPGEEDTTTPHLISSSARHSCPVGASASAQPNGGLSPAVRADDGDPAAGGGDAMPRRADQAAFEHQVVRTRSLLSNRVIQPTLGLLGIERYITIGDSDRLNAPPQRPVAQHTDRSNGQAVARD
jgi:hypothetical protein